MLLAAEQGLRDAKPGSAPRDQAFAQLKLAAQLFDATSSTGIDAPSWGHAEAYLELGIELNRVAINWAPATRSRNP